MGIKVISLPPTLFVRDGPHEWNPPKLINQSSLFLLVAKTERVLALLEETRLLATGLASADRALFLLVLACTERHHVALAATAPVVGAGGGFLFGGHFDVLRKARVCCVVVGHDVALAWMYKISKRSQSARVRAKEDVAHRRDQ